VSREESRLATLVRVSERVVFRDLDGEAVLLDLESGRYFGLDEVGTRVWTLLVEGLDLGAVKAALAQEYDVDVGRLERDILELVDRLAENGLVAIDQA
jgi:hypothetical protein